MTKHAVLSPSGAHRWLMCPGSIEANRNKPWEQSVYALEGTTAHALLETCLRLDCGPEQFLGQHLERDHMAITEDMCDAVGYALDFVRSYLADNPKTTVHIEEPVFPAALLGTKDTIIWGTPDIQLRNFPKELVTIDYKHGVGKAVAVKDNAQIKIYHLGGRVQDGVYRKYRSVVVQPRLPRRKPVQEATLTDKELLTWADKTVIPIIPIALGEDAPRLAGEWCHYCHASGRCPAQLKQTFEKAAKDFGKVQTHPKSVTPAELSGYLAQVPMVKKAIEDMERVATTLLHAGVKVPGFLPSWSNARREWLDEEKTVTAMKKQGLPVKDIYEVMVKSPSKMEDTLKAAGKLAPRKRGQPKPPNPVDDLIGYKDQKQTYAKE